jgi:acyl-CoA hydrolase
MWKYKEKLKTMEQAVEAMPKHAVVVMGMASMETQGFMSQIHKFADHFESLRITSCLNINSYNFCEDPEYQGTFKNDNWFFGPSSRKAQKAGYKLVDFIPNNLHQAGGQRILSAREEGEALIYWGPVSTMDEKTGCFNLGLSNVYEQEVIEAADMVILEVNSKVPRLQGQTNIHINQADMLVEFEAELPTIPIIEPSEIEAQIAAHVAQLVEDGSTLQIGIGGIPNAVAGLLKDKKDLGIHTEMFTESMIDLFECGAINNMKKTLWPGKFVFTFALGSQRMYQWLDNNPTILLLQGKYVNDPYVIAQNDQMVSINTAMAVDLSGQVCSESLGHVQFSGTGGQLDTHRGAQKSKGGRGIIALRSRAKGGTLSTIVPFHAPGAKITVPRQDLDWVATEYGKVHLQGRTMSERARSLISIAHPDFRKDLEAEAEKLGYI